MLTIGLKYAPLIGPNISIRTNKTNPTTIASAITAMAGLESKIIGNKIMGLIAARVRNIDPKNSLKTSFKLEGIKRLL
jgi:ribosomal protein S17E